MATNNYMPMGRNPRSGGAGQAASYKKGGMIKTKKYQGSGSNTVDPTKAINTFKKNTSMKKGGMVAYEKSAYDKKADKLGTHGKEGSAKDMKADKAAAIKLGYMKKGGTTKVAGVMKNGGAKYQYKGAVKSKMVKGIMSINTAANEAKLEASRPKMMKKIVKIKR